MKKGLWWPRGNWGENVGTETALMCHVIATSVRSSGFRWANCSSALHSHVRRDIAFGSLVTFFRKKLPSDLPTKSCSGDIYIHFPSPHVPGREGRRHRGNPQTQPALNGDLRWISENSFISLAGAAFLKMDDTTLFFLESFSMHGVLASGSLCRSTWPFRHICCCLRRVRGPGSP